MGLDLGLVPDIVKPLALPLTANAFPEAEPGTIIRQADALEALADELAAIRAEDAEPLLRHLHRLEWKGAAKEEFEKVLADLAGEGHKASRRDGDGETLLRLLEKATREEARRLREHGVTMEHTQWMQYAALALLGLVIVRLLVWIALRGPSVLSLIHLRTVMTRMSIQALKWRLIVNILGFGAAMGTFDLLVQGAQALFGHREDFDERSALMSLLNGAMTGAMFTGLEFGLSRVATREVVFILSRAELGVRDKIAAIAESIYGRALIGGVSGTVGAIPGLAANDQLDPAHLFYSLIAGTAGGIGIPHSARVSYLPTAAADLPPPHPSTSGHTPPPGETGSPLGPTPKRVIEPTQVTLSGEHTPPAARPEQPTGPGTTPPSRDAAITPSSAPQPEVIRGEVVRKHDGPSQGPLPPADTRPLHGPVAELTGHPQSTASAGHPHNGTPAGHPASGTSDGGLGGGHQADGAGARPPSGSSTSHHGTSAPSWPSASAGHPINAASADHGGNAASAGHPLRGGAGDHAPQGAGNAHATPPAEPPAAGGRVNPGPAHAGSPGAPGHANAAGTPGHVGGGTGDSPLAHVQAARDALPLRTPYVQTAPTTPVQPLPPTTAQDSSTGTDTPQDNERGEAARHNPHTQHHRDTQQPTDQARPLTPRDGSDATPTPRNDAGDPTSTDPARDPARATHTQDVGSGRTQEGQPVVAARLPDGQGPGRATDGSGRATDGQGNPAVRPDHHTPASRPGQSQDGTPVPIGTPHEPPAVPRDTAPRNPTPRDTAPSNPIPRDTAPSNPVPRDTAPAATRETPPARTGDHPAGPPARPGDHRTTPPAHTPDRHPAPPPHPGDAGDPASTNSGQPGAPREAAPTGVHHGDDAGPGAVVHHADDPGRGAGRIDQLINHDGTPAPPLDPAVVDVGHRLGKRLEIPVPDDAYAHTLGSLARISVSALPDATDRDMILGLHRVSRSVGLPAAYDGLVRVYDDAQRQGYDPAGATDRQDLTDRLEQYRQAEPLLFSGLWLANREIPNPSFPLARALGRMDQVIGSGNGTTREARINQLRRLTLDLDLGFYSFDHVGRLFQDAEARGVDVQVATERQDLVRALRQARENDSELWDGLRIAEEHAVDGVDDTAARALSRTDRALHSVAPDARLSHLAAETGFSHAFRTFTEMLAEADAHGALPERPATRAELVDSLTRHRERDASGWDARVMEERFPDARLDPAKATLLGRMDRVIAADGSPRSALDPLLGLSRELGLGDPIRRLAHVADRAQRLGHDPAGAPDRAALVDALRGYLATAPDTWAKVRVSDRYDIKLDDPATRALARMDRIVGSPGRSPAWVLDPLRKLAGDLNLDHSVERLAHVFRGAEERGLDPGGAVDRADLVHRLTSYHRAPAEEPYHFTRTLVRQAEEALTDQLRQSTARDAVFARAAMVRAGDFASDLEAERVRALEARATAWENWPREPEVSYRDNPEAFERDLAEAFARAERGEPVVPYMIEDATGGMAAPGTGIKFAREFEYDFPESLQRHKKAINLAIARDLYDAGLTHDPWVHPYHTSHDTGYDAWRLEEDGTVGGELVPPPLYDTRSTWENIQLVSEIIKSHGGEATPNTGGHIHLDTAVFDHLPYLYHRMLRLVNADYLDTILRLMTNPEHSGHRELLYCQPNTVRSLGYASLDAVLKDHSEHVYALNLKAVKGGPTDHPEFRLPDGSFEPGVIQAQIKLALAKVWLTLRLGDDQFPLNHGDKDLIGTHMEQRMQRDYSSYLELADLLFHRAADKAQLTALFAITRWNERKEAWWV
ncbi:hypothetical protein [Nonomuraea rhodomycinica]|uniref:Uncharacterized protein n=1 Tax=Nonomuraea rhodomycinica TaxID=1712872 RepID=A0A7Y6MFC0_9ACTN|nr:hypothetical protein [Nonomuraea rhodomycinica]NUW45827.1 hypothetical protein [Nonomuraea rhodomycinica]